MKKVLSIISLVTILSSVMLAQGTNQTQTKSLTMKVVAQLVFSTTTLPAGVVNQPYSATLAATGGVLPFAWSGTGLPSWLAIDKNTGVLSSTLIPTSACTGSSPCPFSFSITVTDSTSQVAEIKVEGVTVASYQVLILDQNLFDALPVLP